MMAKQRLLVFRLLVFASILVWILVIIASLFVMQFYGGLNPFAAFDRSLEFSATGTITNLNNSGVGGAKIVIGRGGKNNYVYADSGGRFLVKGIEAGDYDVTVSARGYNDYRSIVDFRNSGDYTFMLVK